MRARGRQQRTAGRVTANAYAVHYALTRRPAGAPLARLKGRKECWGMPARARNVVNKYLKILIIYLFIMNHSSLRIFTFSSDLFNGYTVTLDIHSLQTQEDIINICVQDLMNTLQK